MNATTQSTLQAAIDRSRSRNERVHIEIEATDISEVLAELGSMYDGEIDDAQENDGSHDVWGCVADGEMDWRLCVTLAE